MSGVIITLRASPPVHSVQGDKGPTSYLETSAFRSLDTKCGSVEGSPRPDFLERRFWVALSECLNYQAFADHSFAPALIRCFKSSNQFSTMLICVAARACSVSLMKTNSFPSGMTSK